MPNADEVEQDAFKIKAMCCLSSVDPWIYQDLSFASKHIIPWI